MEEVLQLCDTSGSDYPEYFKEFLNNCLEQFPNFLANDYLFAAVYFMVLECGFFPVTLYDDYPNQCSDNFDIRKLRFIKSYSANHTKFVKGQIGEFWVYTIPLRLGEYRYNCFYKMVLDRLIITGS